MIPSRLPRAEQSALEHSGRIDIVINNAGNQRNVCFGELTEQDIDAVYAVHVKGTSFLTQPAYQFMKQQEYGRIVLVSSQSGIFGNPIRRNYGSAKTAMIRLMNVVAQEAPPGVVINCVFPNAVGGRLGGKPGDVRPDADFLAAPAKKVPHYIAGMQPSFVAPLVTYLASKRCTTSQNMYSVLGGKYSRIFVGLTHGWYQPGETPPTAEDIEAHLPQIDDMSSFDLPKIGLDEMDTVIPLQQRLKKSPGPLGGRHETKRGPDKRPQLTHVLPARRSFEVDGYAALAALESATARIEMLAGDPMRFVSD